MFSIFQKLQLLHTNFERMKYLNLNKVNLNSDTNILVGYNDLSDLNAVKFQKRTPKELLTEKEYYSPHPNPTNS